MESAESSRNYQKQMQEIEQKLLEKDKWHEALQIRHR